MQYIVIPARYGSTRLLGKPLLQIGGRYVLFHVLDRVKEVFDLKNVRVATDDEKIIGACEMYGVKAVMTSLKHDSGTARINEVCEIEGWDDNDQIVNVQGDEPFIPSEFISLAFDALNESLKSHPQGIGTLCADIKNYKDIFDPNVVKVVKSNSDRALYFSRAAIPWDRDTFHYDVENIDQPFTGNCFKHIGIYSYTVGGLKSISTLKSQLEHVEKLEQLKLLENDISVVCKKVEKAPMHGIDTRADLKNAEIYWNSINEG